MTSELEQAQEEVCRRYGQCRYPVQPGQRAGVAFNVRDGMTPVNGLRHPPQGDTTGWYIWAGEELFDDPEFFKPLHIEHLATWRPEIQKYLGLPPGWRFLVAPHHEDVWYDESLLHV